MSFCFPGDETERNNAYALQRSVCHAGFSAVAELGVAARLATSSMRKLGLAALLIGFAWLVWQVRVTFVQHQYVRSIWQTQHLPAGESISRLDAAKALNELSTDIKDYEQQALIPAVVMLAGGLLSAFAPRRATDATNVA